MHISVACENDGEYGDATCITNTPEGEYATTGNGGDWVAFVPHDRRHQANARLIAAAPELLAALKDAEVEIDIVCRWVDEPAAEAVQALANARKAIAKAEGRSE
jgi:hypothetical protein